MTTKIAIDDQLLNEALRLGGHHTKVATVHEALLGYIQHRKQARVIDLFGTIDFAHTHNYKKQRRRS